MPVAVDSGPGGSPGRFDRVTRYTNEAVLPFYVLHQTPIVIIGFYVVQWDLNLSPSTWSSAWSLVVTLAVYDLLVA